MRINARLLARSALVLLILAGGERIFLGGSSKPGSGGAEATEVRRARELERGRWRRKPTTTTTRVTAVPIPTTVAPTTTRPPATLAPTTVPPTTVPPTTVPPPTTRPPVTVAPTTLAPTTVPPTTLAPTTVPPTTLPPTTVPPTTGRFATVAPGGALPSGATCAGRVRAAGETRTQNATYNQTVGTRANTSYPRVDGQYRGTTDQVLQWAACKWGIDEDVVRAQMAVESWWSMLTVGDNGESFGLGQVRVPYHQSAFVDDNAKRSSAYNVDYTYAVFRSCFEGELTWLNTVERVGTYAAGDLWGCIGVWFSGRWHTPAAEGYIAKVQDYLAQRVWTTPSFAAYTG